MVHIVGRACRVYDDLSLLYTGLIIERMFSAFGLETAMRVGFLIASSAIANVDLPAIKIKPIRFVYEGILSSTITLSSNATGRIHGNRCFCIKPTISFIQQFYCIRHVGCRTYGLIG